MKTPLGKINKVTVLYYCIPYIRETVVANVFILIREIYYFPQIAQFQLTCALCKLCMFSISVTGYSIIINLKYFPNLSVSTAFCSRRYW